MSLRRDLYEVWTLGGLSRGRLVRRVWHALTAGDLLGYAAQLAYYFLFALFPFFIFLAALLAYVPVPYLMDEIMAVVEGFLAQEAAAMIRDNVADLITKPRGGLLSFSILFALFLASSAVAAIGEALNRAYGVRESRPLWRVRGTAMVLTVVLAGLAIGSNALLIFGPEVGGWLAGRLGVGEAFHAVWPFIRWPIVVYLLMLSAALVYYYTPDVEQQWRWITPGSVLAVLAWIAVSLGFRYYVDNFGRYNATYGSIGAIIVLLTWLYMSGLMLLIGGEINAEIEHAAKGGKGPGEKRLPRASQGPEMKSRWQLGLRRR